MQEERGPRKTTRLRKLISNYGVLQRGKIHKSGIEKDSKHHIENSNFPNAPNYSTLDMHGKFKKEAHRLNPKLFN